jgi:riboflavin kinase/FMN adenylyltransferase
MLDTRKGEAMVHRGNWRDGLRYELVEPSDRSETAQTRLIIEGRVQLGDQRGRTLGFPTANVPVASGNIRPPQGVFAGYVHVEGAGWYEAAVSVGSRATFYSNGELLVEAHLLDFEGDLYGRLVVIELVAHLRDQVKFGGVDELRAQLHRDIAQCRAVLVARRPRLSSVA